PSARPQAGSVALTSRGTIGSASADLNSYHILWLDRVMQQMGVSNRSPLNKPFLDIARRYYRRSVDGSRTEGIAIALLVLFGASDGRLPGAGFASRSTPVRR